MTQRKQFGNSRRVRVVSDWMSASRLKLNPTKMEVLWLGSSQQMSQISITDLPLQSTKIRVSELPRDFGVVIDSKLSPSAHVAALCRSGFYHLRQLHPVLRSLTQEAARTLVQVFIASRLDYCNSLLYGVSRSLTRKVQSVQNVAAWLLTRTRCGNHISPVLCQLHWLPVQRWVDFKLACFVFSSLSGQVPPYLADDITWRKALNIGCVHLPTDRVLFHATTTRSATEVLLPLSHMCGTAS